MNRGSARTRDTSDDLKYIVEDLYMVANDLTLSGQRELAREVHELAVKAVEIRKRVPR